MQVGLLWQKTAHRPKELPGILTVAAAGTGGLMYWLAIYPIDQIKSAMQTDSIIKAERKYPTMGAAFSVRRTAALQCMS